MKVLVVEDDHNNVLLFRLRLTKAGHEVVFASNGEEGIQAAKDHSPDVILMDMRMPVLDGYEATKQLKADPNLKEIPVIGISAHAAVADQHKAEEAGCDAYITKPVQFAILLEKIAEFG